MIVRDHVAKHERFHLADLEQLREELKRLGLSIPLDEDLSILAEPLKIGRLTVPNRFLIQPMEGFDAEPDGGPGELAFRRYRRYAEGGSGFIWFEATAFMTEARSNPRQLLLHRGSLDGFKRLVEATRKAAPGREMVFVLQINHSGRYSKPQGFPEPIIAHHNPVLDPIHGLGPETPLVSDDYLDRLPDAYVEAAKLARDAGFDGVDIKSCHRYLISELLASFTREGRYGGTFENRTRLLLETLRRIAAEVPGLFITTRMNAYDGIPHPHGFGVDQKDWHVEDLREPIALAKKLEATGMPVLNVSIGNPYYNPHVGRPYDFTIHGMKPPEEHPLEGVERFVRITRAIQEAVPRLPIVATGYGWLRHLMPYVAAGVLRSGAAALIGQGRGAFAYPDSPKDIFETGRMDPAKCCVACSACAQIMRDGRMTGCVAQDSEIYGPEYRLGRRFAKDHLVKEAERCRDCEEPTCVAACPAHVDIPGFVRAYARGDVADAYAILRGCNVLPEMCAFVCPSEVQCEGGCLERVFCENPIPIRDIQMAVSLEARRKGLTGVSLPEPPSGKRVAVVGGGPAGIACAIALLEKGHEVKLLDKADRLGGLPEEVIPTDRIVSARAEVDAILAPALEAGRLVFVPGRVLGRDCSLEDLRNDHDAVFLAIGLTGTVSLGSAEGVLDALTFLREVKAGWARSPGRSVAVLGGGNTAMDAAMAAARLGVKDVYIVYRRSFREMPDWPGEREAVLAAGIHLLALTQPLGYETDAAGRLTGLRIVRTVLGEPDASGRRRPVPVKGSESMLAVDAVIEAIGQRVPDEIKAALAPLEFTRNGLLKAGPDSGFTGVKGVYAGGDIVNGGTTAVQGVAEGMRAAVAIDASFASEG